MLSLIKHKLETHAVKVIGGQKVLSIQIDITNACNLSCAHCYHTDHLNKGAIGFDEWKEILTQYKAMIEDLRLRPKIVICGGEPIVSPLLLPLVRFTNDLLSDVSISILTNGTRLTDLLLNQLHDYNVEFQISLDGPDRDRHDAIRGRGVFDAATDAVIRARKMGFNVYLLSILSLRSKEWTEDFFKLASQLKVSQMNFIRFVSEGSGKTVVNLNQDRALNPTELRETFTNIWEFSKKYRVPTNTRQALFHLIDPRLGSNDRFGYQGLVVDYKGNLKVSSRVDVKIGNVLERGLKKLFFESQLLTELRQGKIEKCGDCEFYNKCGGSRNASFSATGSFLKADPGCWI